MKTAIMTDSNSGISKSEARKLGVYSLPMPVIIDGETHYDSHFSSSQFQTGTFTVTEVLENHLDWYTNVSFKVIRHCLESSR